MMKNIFKSIYKFDGFLLYRFLCMFHGYFSNYIEDNA